mgnify:CR=1 FL=1
MNPIPRTELRYISTAETLLGLAMEHHTSGLPLQEKILYILKESVYNTFQTCGSSMGTLYQTLSVKQLRQ